MQAILHKIPPIFMRANFTGLPSCLSLAKGMMVIASVAIMPIHKYKYSGCSEIFSKCATGPAMLNNKADKTRVEIINEVEAVL